MGGNVRAGNLVHREALVAQELQQRYPRRLRAVVFANHDGESALHTVLATAGRQWRWAAERRRKERRADRHLRP